MKTSAPVAMSVTDQRGTQRGETVHVSRGLRRQFLALLVVVAAVPLLLVGVWDNARDYASRRSEAVVEQRFATDRAETEILFLFAAITSDLEAAVRISDPATLQPSDRAALLGSLLATNRAFRSASFIDATGQETQRISRVVATPLLDMRNLASSKVFETAMATGGTYFGPISVDPTSGLPTMEVAVPYSDLRTGEASGVLLAEVRLKEVWETLGTSQAPGRSITAYLLDQDGVVVAHPNPSLVLASTVFQPEAKDGFQPGLEGENVILTIETINLGSQELQLIAESPAAEALVPYFRDLAIRIATLAAALVLAIAAAFMIARHMAKPILKLAEAASALSAGDPSQRVDVARDDEIGLLATAFNEMADRIAAQISELGDANRSLETMLASKSQFLAAVSHELRTPLTSVIGFAELLRDTGNELAAIDRHEMVNLIAEQGGDLVNIVEDLLIAARAESGDLTVSRVSVNLRAQVAQVLEARSDKNTTFIAIDDGDVRAEADPGRVRQIVRNLLSNADKYGGESVRIELTQHATTAHLAVIDNGPGVPEADRDRIFRLYHRAHHHADVGPGSVGVGLSVSRDLARLMNGDLTYRRHHNETIFELTLPAVHHSSTMPTATNAIHSLPSLPIPADT